MNDKLGAADWLSAGLSTDSSAAHFPCPKCGRESKEQYPVVESVPGQEDVVTARRICAMPTCRYEGDSEEFVSKTVVSASN